MISILPASGLLVLSALTLGSVPKPARLPTLEFDAWLAPNALGGVTSKPRATLYRWWTTGCPFCQASLPSVEALRKEFGPLGLEVVGVFHPKPPGRKWKASAVLREARRLGFNGRVAVDSDWSELAKVDPEDDGVTSIALVVDGKGIIRMAHPGPQFFPSKDPKFAAENRGYEEIRNTIEAILMDLGRR